MREQQIRDIVEQELDRAREITRSCYWAIQYTGFEFLASKNTYGMAMRTGKIRISRIYLNTREFAHLKDTIRHEIAHLMCGMNANHDANWRHAARLLGCKPRATQPLTGDLHKTAKPKWRLVGTLENGKEVAFQASHVRQSKYLKPNKSFTCQQGKIVSCKYVRNV